MVGVPAADVAKRIRYCSFGEDEGPKETVTAGTFGQVTRREDMEDKREERDLRQRNLSASEGKPDEGGAVLCFLSTWEEETGGAREGAAAAAEMASGVRSVGTWPREYRRWDTKV